MKTKLLRIGKAALIYVAFHLTFMAIRQFIAGSTQEIRVGAQILIMALVYYRIMLHFLRISDVILFEIGKDGFYIFSINFILPGRDISGFSRFSPPCDRSLLGLTWIPTMKLGNIDFLFIRFQTHHVVIVLNQITQIWIQLVFYKFGSDSL